MKKLPKVERVPSIDDEELGDLAACAERVNELDAVGLAALVGEALPALELVAFMYPDTNRLERLHILYFAIARAMTDVEGMQAEYEAALARERGELQ